VKTLALSSDWPVFQPSIGKRHALMPNQSWTPAEELYQILYYSARNLRDLWYSRLGWGTDTLQQHKLNNIPR
jgi:hypothetical protein